MMRRFDESQANELNQAIKLGEDNAECISQMRSWCKYVEIERTTEGLYAQMTGLPIASHSIGCLKVEGMRESMNLRCIFSNFLVKHCATCPHHTPNGDTSWGQEIIDKHRIEVQERTQAAETEAERISQLRSDLREKSKEISSESESESYRILEYLETIFSENEAERKEAAERLQQSARLGADLFPEAAIDLILLLAGSNDFSDLMLPVCTELASRRSELGSRFSQVAFDNIEKGQYTELSAEVINALDDAVEYPLSEVCIKHLIFSQNHSCHSTTVIVRNFDTDPESVQDIIRRELQNENVAVRFQLCGAIKLIQCERPQIVENLLGDLVQSLEFYENTRSHEVRPSRQIIQILQSAFRCSSERVDQFLAGSMIRVRPAVQEDIVLVYLGQFFDQTISWDERHEHRNRTEVDEQEKIAIKRLLSWTKDDRFEIDIRSYALEALKIACMNASAEMLNHFDSLLGYFAIISGEERPPSPPPTILLPNQTQAQDTQLEQLEELGRIQEWDLFKGRLQGCLNELCKANPSETFDSVFNCLNQPPVHLEDEFKVCCVSLLGELGKNYTLQTRVLPLIWRTLMDYDSAWVRAKAINATVEMFSFSTTMPPQNLVDTIVVHLQDPKVIVHQAARQAVARCSRWFNKSQLLEVLNCLEAHLRVYHNDKYQLESICDAILKIGQQDAIFKPVALRLVESVFPTKEDLVDSKIAESLIWFCEPSEEIAKFVAKDIGVHLAHHSRDRYNYYGHSKRLRFFEWLHKLPEATYQHVAGDLLVSAQKLAKLDPWESCHFASLFTHFRSFRYEQKVLETAFNALPEEPRNKAFRTKLKQLAMIAAGNASLQTGDIVAAEAYFAKGKDKT